MAAHPEPALPLQTAEPYFRCMLAETCLFLVVSLSPLQLLRCLTALVHRAAPPPGSSLQKAGAVISYRLCPSMLRARM